MKNKILVCGAGNGGHAIAGYAALQGYDTIFYTHTPEKAELINNQDNTIYLSGKIVGQARLSKVTYNLEEALQDREFIFIVTDATAHKAYAQAMAHFLTDQNIILVSPGVGGAMEFVHQVRKINPNEDISVTETDTLIYSCKVPKIGSSYIKEIKRTILYATIPSFGRKVDDFIRNMYPQFHNTSNPLMGLDDSPVLHVVGMIKNAKRILNGEDFNFYIDGINQDAAEYMEKMDEERCKVAQCVGIKPRSVKLWLNKAYGVPMASLYDMIQNTPPYQNTAGNPNRSPAPKTLFHRYLIEEISLRAIPTVHIAKIFGIPTSCYLEMVEEAIRLTGIDFWKDGRDIQDMGLNEENIKHWDKDYLWTV